MRKLSIEELGRLSIEAFRAAKKVPIVLVLDDLRSRYNVGSLLRSADAFRIEKVYLGGFTPQPPHPEIHRAALGAEESVAWEKVPNLSPLLTYLQETGYTLIAIEQTDQSVAIWDFSWPKPPLALVLGHEVAGLSEEALTHCQYAIEIPQFGTKHSLNVAVAGSIALYEAVKALRLQGLSIC